MKKVPKMITAKDVDYIKDMFDWNMVAYKKIDYFKNDISSEKMAELFITIADMHYSFCEKLISLLESGDDNEW